MTLAERAASAGGIEAELLSYDAETGLLTWRARPIDLFPDDYHMRTWNTRFAGKPAFARCDLEGYMVGKIFGRHRLAHRVIWAIVHGSPPTGEIDHIDGDRTNNRLANLRDVTPRENQQNRRVGANNSSGFMGVVWSKRDRRWVARITLNGKGINLGSYASKNDAVSARKAAEEAYGFHANHGRTADHG